MKAFDLFSILVFLGAFIFTVYLYVKEAIERIPKEAWLTPEQVCEKYNFPMERHYITTEDGYILTVLRIKHGSSGHSPNKKVVLMQHGLIATPMSFLVNTPERGSAFLLSNAGYDVWLGSSRGNEFARNHTTLDPDKDKEFWDFTWQQMGKYDLFAQIGYIKNLTGVEKIGYVGYSQGTLEMFYALSEFQSQLKKSIYAFGALTPVARAGNHKSVFVNYFKHAVTLHQFFGAAEYMPRNKFFNGIQQFICANWKYGCNKMMNYLSQGIPENNDHEQAAITFAHFPGGTSVKNQKHWNEMIRLNKFQLYDYGLDQNFRRYNQYYPPEVDLTKIHDVPIALFVGQADLVTVPEDIDWLRSQLDPNVLKFDKTYQGYGHLSFCIGKNADYVQDLIAFLDKYEKEQKN